MKQVIRRESAEQSSTATTAGSWTYLSNHSHVLVCLAEDPEARIRDIAERVDITERAVQRILSELEEAGVVEKERIGRRNRYHIHADKHLRHPVEGHCRVDGLLSFVIGPNWEQQARRS
jgi:DNA-binding transcriptional ArsR family regulator